MSFRQREKLLFLFVICVFTSLTTIAYIRRFIGRKFGELSDESCPNTTIQLYPKCANLKLPQMYWRPCAKETDLTNLAVSTDAMRSRVWSDSGQEFVMGRRFKANIVAKDYRNKLKNEGGDFFQAILLRKNVDGDGVACEITDHANGTYTVEAPLLWEGEAVLRILLIHPSEAVKALTLKTSYKDGKGFGFTSRVKDSDTNKTEVLKCGPFLNSRATLCDLSDPTHGAPWYCEKPKSGCGALTNYGRDDSLSSTKRWHCEWAEYLDTSKNWMVEVTGSGLTFNISKRKEFEDRHIATFRTNNKNFSKNISGWFLNQKWHSTRIKNQQFSKTFATKCLNHTDFHIFGDSTARQFFSFLFRSLGLKKWETSTENYPFQPLEANSTKQDIRLFLKSHGPPLQHRGSYESRPYVSVSMEDIGPGHPKRRVKILLSLGLHFLSFKPTYFRQRVRLIKNSIVKLQHRLPDAKIAFKEINFHYEFGYYLPRAQWLCHRLNSILHEELRNLPNVAIIEAWSMTLVQTPRDVHPKEQMIYHQAGLILSYLCTE